MVENCECWLSVTFSIMWNVKTENREAREARRISGSKKLTGPFFSFTAHLVFHMGTHEEWVFHFFPSVLISVVPSVSFMIWNTFGCHPSFYLANEIEERVVTCSCLTCCLTLVTIRSTTDFFDIVSLNVGTLKWFSDHSINFYALYNSLNIYSSTMFPSLLRSAQNLIVDLYGF